MVHISLKVKLIDGREAIIATENDSTIAELREEILKALQIPVERQRIIFQGKVLNDNSRKLHECGLEDNMALHVVEKQPPDLESQNRQQQQAASPDHDYAAIPNTSPPYIVTQNLIIGQVPFERTAIFQEPTQALVIVAHILEQMRSQYRMEAEHSLQINRPQEHDFSINVTFRGMPHQFVDSPARERFEAIRVEMRKLAWLVVLIQSQFNEHVDQIITGVEQPDDFRAYQAIAIALRAMHAFDHFDEQALQQIVMNMAHRDAELYSLIEALGTLQLEEDEHHLQELSPNMTMRHCTSFDLSNLLMMLEIIDAKINEHLLSRYHQVLRFRHNLEISSYPARMLNCFGSAIIRVQHFRAHIYHTLSDLNVHIDQNEHNRLYPQLAQPLRRREEPPQAEISLVFFDPAHVPNAAQTEQMQNDRARITPPQLNRRDQNSREQQPPRGALNSMLSGFLNFAQQLVGAGVSPMQQTPTGRFATTGPSRPHPPISRIPTRIQFSPSSQTSAQSSNQAHVQPQPRSLSADRVPLDSPHPHNDDGGAARLRPIGTSVGHHPYVSWGRTPPEAPNAMFIGQNPPTHLPLFTMDPFLACPSSRYQVFEVDSRHGNFWNDNETIAQGLHPPLNSVASLQRGNGPTLGNSSIVRQQNQDMEGGSSSRRVSGPPEVASMSNEDISIQPQANHNGEAVFNEVGQFAQFVRQTLETVANCMARYDSRILPQSVNASQRGFTADSRVAGFIPLISMPMPFPMAPPHFGNTGPPGTGGHSLEISFSIPNDAMPPQQTGQNGGNGGDENGQPGNM